MIARPMLRFADFRSGSVLGRQEVEITLTTRKNIVRGTRAMDASAHFLKRAKHYRFLAAMTENPPEIERLCDIAFMFEQMARDVKRLRQGRPRFPAAGWHRAESPPIVGGVDGFTRIWHALAEFIRLPVLR